MAGWGDVGGITVGTTNDAILPGLPYEVALLCLARLPLRAQARCRCVSRALYHALRPPPDNPHLQLARRRLGVREIWVFLCVAIDGCDDEPSREAVDFLLLDTGHLRCHSLRPPAVVADGVCLLQAIPCNQEGKLLLHGFKRNEAGSLASAYDLIALNVPSRRWCFGVPRMVQEDRLNFAWAHLDGFIYIAGGRPKDLFSLPRRSAERFNLETELWEVLPSMTERRYQCSGFAMDGCFYVMGGSAEFFDPKLGVWTLAPHMQLAGMAKLAMVNQQLYAITFQSPEVLWYNKQQQHWVNIGSLPREVEIDEHILGVGDELWHLSSDCAISCCKPQGASGGVLAWNVLPLHLPCRQWFENIIAFTSFEL